MLVMALTTHEKRLPQGAPTSPIIANLICRRLDSRIEGLARKHDLAYTRYADDIIVSGNLPSRIERSIRTIVESEGFEIAPEKIRIRGPGARQIVTGLVVNEGVNWPRDRVRRLRGQIHVLTRGRMSSPSSPGRNILMRQVIGEVNALRQVRPDIAERFHRLLHIGRDHDSP